MEPVKVGIVGYGFSAKNFHLPFLKAIPDYMVIAILQRSEAPSDKSSIPPGIHCSVDYPQVRHYRTSEDFFADPEIALVVVATQIDTHASFAEKALLSGKHVIVDKPFARSADEADHVINLARNKGLILTCFQNRRWDGDFQTLRRLVGNNVLGTIKEAEIHYDFETPPWLSSMTEKVYTPGAGMAFGLGTHSIDQAIVLFGRPKSVTGFFRVQRGIDSEVEDSFTIILQYDGVNKDLLVTVKTSVVTPMERQLKYLIRGTKGSYLKFQPHSTCVQEEQIAMGINPLDLGFGVEPEEFNGVLTTLTEVDHETQKFDELSKSFSSKYPTVPGRWMGLYENVAAAIRGLDELEVKPTQSRDGLRVIELARESHEKGITVLWR
ncbi:nad binding rossmann fold-containing protein [Lipomyces doorenjongii]